LLTLFPNIRTLPPFQRNYYQSSYCDFVIRASVTLFFLHILMYTVYVESIMLYGVLGIQADFVKEKYPCLCIKRKSLQYCRISY